MNFRKEIEIMTKAECVRCEKLVEEAIRKAKDAQKDFADAWKEDDQTQRKILSERGQNHLGYAEGINQTLVCIGFKHERMKELGNLLQRGWLMEMKSTNAEEVACNFKDWLVDLGYMTLEDGIQDEQEIVNDFYVLEEKCPKLFNLFRNICDR